MTAHDWEAILLPELRQALPEYAGAVLTLNRARPSRAYTYSQMHFFTLLADGRPVQELAVKELNEADRGKVQVEFAGMKRLWALLADHPVVRTPRPLFCLDQPPALAMETVAGERLSSILAACRRPQRGSRIDNALAFLRRAGEGLALLHRTPPAADAIALAPPTQRAEAALHCLQELGVAARQTDALRRDLEALLQAPAPDAAAVTLHGDYTLRNLLCAADGKIFILDTALNVAGPWAHDVGYFLAALAFIDRWQLLAGTLAYSPAMLVAMRQAFLNGYGPAPGLDARQLALFTALRLLERWGQYAETMQAERSRPARLLFAARAQGHFAGAVAETVQGWDGDAQDRV